jgi:hypothetical protein
MKITKITKFQNLLILFLLRVLRVLRGFSGSSVRSDLIGTSENFSKSFWEKVASYPPICISFARNQWPDLLSFGRMTAFF